MSGAAEFPLSEMPLGQRKSVFSIVMVLLGFTFFTGTMFAGGSLGVAFSIKDMLWIAVMGNVLLACYAAALGFISAKTGLNALLMGRFCFGQVGSKLSDMLLGFAELGWYAWGTATLAISLIHLLNFPTSLPLPLLGVPVDVSIPLMVALGIGFSLTAVIGFKGLDMLSRLSVPLMMVMLATSIWLATRKAGGWSGLTAVVPTQTMSWSSAITMVFGTFASGATQATNWTRMSRSGRVAVTAAFVSFAGGNGLMIVAGGWCAIVYQRADIVEVMGLQGLSLAAVVMLFLNLWTIQGPTIYNVSAAACHLLRTERRRTVTLLSAGMGIVLAIGGMYKLLIPFLLLLGTVIPSIGGVIMADYWFCHRGRYPAVKTATLPRFNVKGLVAYAVGAALAYASPWVAPVVGIAASAAVYMGLVACQARMRAGNTL